MLVFCDTEFTDFLDFELISIGLVSEDGRHELYLEVQAIDRQKCNAFVQAAVLPQLGQVTDAVVGKDKLADRLREWFSALPYEVMLACDSPHDRDQLSDVLDGEWPANIAGWLTLQPAAAQPIFNEAVTQYHAAGHPWHHALHDAHALRAGWQAWQAAFPDQPVSSTSVTPT